VAKTLRIVWNVLLNKPKTRSRRRRSPSMPSRAPTSDAAPNRSLFRLGHSTMLIKLRGGLWITDPVFAERASPVQWMGPKRFHAPPIALDDLPPLRGVLLSHDHYDHLDRDDRVAPGEDDGGVPHAARRRRSVDRVGRGARESAAVRLVAGHDDRRRAVHRHAGAAFFRARSCSMATARCGRRG
jgi:hypothetical protein